MSTTLPTEFSPVGIDGDGFLTVQSNINGRVFPTSVLPEQVGLPDDFGTVAWLARTGLGVDLAVEPDDEPF